jgi:hypothetical protein
LFRLRQQLLQSLPTNNFISSKEDSQLRKYAGIKLHMLSHLPENISRYGCAHPAYLGELSEKYHKEFAKDMWNSISKRVDTVDKEMLNLHLQRQYIKHRRMMKAKRPVNKIVEAEDEIRYYFNKNMDCLEIKYSELSKQWESVNIDHDPQEAILSLFSLKNVYDIVSEKVNRESQHFSLNFDDEEIDIIGHGLNGTNNVRVYLLHHVSATGLKSKKIDPFQLYSTNNFRNRQTSHSIDDAQFSFVEIIYKDENDNDVDHLARTAFMLAFDVYDGMGKYTNVSVFVGGYVFLKDSTTVMKSDYSLPYRHQQYYVSQNPIKKQYPEVDIVPFTMISAPAFVVNDPDSNADTSKEIFATRVNRHWLQNLYFWIPFKWTCRNDSIQMNDFDFPATCDEQARDRFFTISAEDLQLQTSIFDNDEENEEEYPLLDDD